VDTVFLALRVIVSLGAVFGALWAGHRWITKGRPGLRLQAKAISVAARQGLGAKAGVAIVEADGRRYLLGVTEHSVTVLDRLDRLDGPVPAVQQTALTVVTATGPVPAVGGSTQAETRVVSVVSTGPVPAVGGQGTRVVSVLTTGPVPTERFAAQAPDGATAFEQELAFATSFTATISLPAPQTAEPLPEIYRIEPAGTDRARPEPALAEPAVAGTIPAAPLTRRAARAAESAKAASSPAASPLAGSILSPETWRQTVAALKRAK
jgi:flagellar biogenesis protein FliO